MTELPTFDPDTEQRLAAAQAAGAEKSGIPWESFTDVEMRENAASGEAMAAVAGTHICGVLDADGVYFELKEFDTCDQTNPDTGKRVPQGDMILQMLAAQRLEAYHQDCREDKEGLLDTRRAPGYVERDPLTHTRLYVLTPRSRHAVALETPYDWRGYIREELRSETKCNVHLLASCYDHQTAPAALTLVYKRGEFVFAWKICSECSDALSWIKYGDPRYAGPLHKWVDDGDRGATDDDPFGLDTDTDDTGCWDF
jgi:hypothetical protein